MSKFIVGALAAASILALSVPAVAGWYDAYGYYHPACYWVWNGYGYGSVCY